MYTLHSHKFHTDSYDIKTLHCKVLGQYASTQGSKRILGK